jgi:hypothetical protein
LTGVPANAVPLILAQCSGVICLAIFQTPPDPAWLPLIAVMSNLRQLSADINPLFIRDRVDFNHSIFAGITHLDMFETPLSENWVTDIQYAAFLVSHISRSISTAQVLLSTLFMCITLSQIQNPSRFSYSFSGVLIIKQNSMICTNVSATIHGLWLCLFLISWGIVPPVETYWIQAERFIQKRRSGEIKGSAWIMSRCILIHIPGSDYVVPLRSA